MASYIPNIQTIIVHTVKRLLSSFSFTELLIEFNEILKVDIKCILSQI